MLDRERMREYQRERRRKIRDGENDTLTRRVDDLDRRVEVLERNGEYEFSSVKD